jgi:hypothetical protein
VVCGTAKPLTITFEGNALSDGHRATFTADAIEVFRVLDRIRADRSIPPIEVQLVVAGSFAAAVQANQRQSEGPFDAERPFGKVAAKNLAQDDRGERVVIVFDAVPWSSDEGGYDRFQALGTIAHELAHPILERARHSSGVLDGVTFPSFTPGEIARSISREGLDEYRADAICDIVLAQVASKTVDGASVPAVTWDAAGESYVRGVQELFSRLHPNLPDVVQTYREWRMDIESMWREVVRESEGLVTAYIHARAHADQSDAPVAILDSIEIRELPFVRLYLKDTMPPYVEAVREGPLLPSLAEFAAIDRTVVDAGEKMLREIWGRLGLSFTEDSAARTFGIHVAEPIR